MAEFKRHTPLRILMTTDTVGGVWSYSVELCKALRPFGVEFYLITTGAPLQLTQKEEIKKVKNVTVYETDFLLEWMDSPWESIDQSADWLLQLEEKVQPDLIHLNAFAYGSLSWKAPVAMVAHSDVFSWWRLVKAEDPPAAWKNYFKRVSKGLAGANFLIAPSSSMMQHIRGIYSASVGGTVIYNGRSSDVFYPAQKEPFIFSMGRIWDEAKNISLLVAAAPQIPYEIKIAGDNNFAGDSCNMAGSNVTYLGKLSTAEVAKQAAAASVYVLAAKYEPFGLSVLEAALSGCALVLGNIDSLKEIWSDSAMYMDTNDAAALATTVNYLMQNEDVRLQYAHKAQSRAATYGIEVMAEEYMKVYQQLLKT